VWSFYVFYFFNALGYVCGGPLPCQVLVSRWFDQTRGKAMGIAYLGIGVGGAIVPLLAAWLTTRFGWRGSLQMVGVLIVAIAFPMAFFVDDTRRAARPASPPQEGQQSALQPSISSILSTPAFYLLAIGSMCSIAAVGGTNQHLKLFLSIDREFTQADAARIISLVLAVSIGGRLLMGWLADRLPRKVVMLAIYVLVAAAIPLLLVPAAAAWNVYLFALVFGIGLGGEYLIIPLMAGELFGVGVLGRVMGIILTADGVAEATAPMFVGYLHDRTGSYELGFSLLIVTALLGAAAIASLPAAGRVRRVRESRIAPPPPAGDGSSYGGPVRSAEGAKAGNPESL
jgi:sugar phosphate permease